MPVARTRSVALLGLTGSVVEVEADLSSQLPGFVIIGLPDAALAEARERVRSAAVNAGCPLPQRKLTVNLSPAALPKHGSGFDLAIAIACLAAAGELSVESVDRVVHLGELGLDGRLRPIDGILPAVLAAARAGHDTVMVPDGERGRGGAGARRRGDRRRVAARGGDPARRRVRRSRRRARARPHPRRRRPTRPRSATSPTSRATTTPSTRCSRRRPAGTTCTCSARPARARPCSRRACPGILPDLDADAALEVSSIRSLSGRALGAELSRPPAVRGAAPHGHRRGDRRRRQPASSARAPRRAPPTASCSSTRRPSSQPQCSTCSGSRWSRAPSASTARTRWHRSPPDSSS